MNAPLLEVDQLVVDYRLPRTGWGRRRINRAVDHVDLVIAPGEMLGLVGESGSGKSTVARAILGLAPSTSGSMRFAGRPLTGDASSRSRQTDHNIQVVFQNPYGSLNPAHTIGEAIGEPLRVHRRLDGEQLRHEVAQLLTRVGLDPGAATRYPRAFSGGQRQRIALARAIALRPSLIIYDEAVSALDTSSRGAIVNLISQLQREHRIAGLFIGHDLDIVRHVSDRIAVIYRGRIVEAGAAVDVADEPRHPYTQRLVDAILRPDPAERITDRVAVRRVRQNAGHTPAGCAFVADCPIRVEACVAERPELFRQGDRWVACHVAEMPVERGTSNPGGATSTPPAPLACVEVGGSGTQTIVFGAGGLKHYDGVHVAANAPFAIAVPGLIDGNRVVEASNLGWYDVDPAAALGLRGRAIVIANDAEAAALGEWELRGRPDGRLVFIGLGTGVGGAIVEGGRTIATNRFAHRKGYSDRACVCGEVGCLETVVGGWSLPRQLGPNDLDVIATRLAVAIDNDDHARAGSIVVVGGGIARRHPGLIESLGQKLEGQTVEPSRAPSWAKSAAPWGLVVLAREARGEREVPLPLEQDSLERTRNS